MSDKIHASVGILTYNSAKTLERALQSVMEFDDIIICDGGSTDATLELAQKYGARIIPQDPSAQGAAPITDYSRVRNRCLDEAKYDWFVYIDSDETIEQGLVDEIRDLVAKNEPGVRVYRVSPRIIYQGQRIEYTTTYPAYQFRLSKRGPGLHFKKAVHERLDIPSGAFVGTVSGHWNFYLRGADEIREDVYSRDIPLLLLRYANKPKSARFRGMYKALKSIVRVLVKYPQIRLRHSGPEVMPWEVEAARMWVQWQYVKALLKSLF